MNFGLHINTRYSCHILFFSEDFRKKSNIKFHKNLLSESQVVLCGQTGRRTDMTQLIVTFRNFANKPINYFKESICDFVDLGFLHVVRHFVYAKN
jgi:hypothetical protein